jgi:hypothetical protein
MQKIILRSTAVQSLAYPPAYELQLWSPSLHVHVLAVIDPSCVHES